MLPLILRRAVEAVPTLVLVTVTVFLVVHVIPGDPALFLAGDQAREEDVAGVRRHLGLDRPYHLQYLGYLGRILRGDLGYSFTTRTAVADVIAPRVWPSVQLALAAMTLAALLGLTTGIVAALRPHGWIDTVVSTVSLLGVTVPTFWLGLMLMWLLAVHWQLVPSFGTGTWKHVVMPAITLGAAPLGIIARLTRSEMLEVLQQDFIRTAWAKGLARHVVVLKHALRNMLLPAVNFVGMQIGIALGYAVVTETVFAWPGLGRLLIDSVTVRDYPTIQGLILLFAAVFIALNVVVDGVAMWVDPRTRHAG
jgi:ABC-type dipeptide/oligopeptide/nickel transport system permease component